MSLRRNQILDHMGIIPYTIRHYHVFQGEMAITLPVMTRLVIVSHRLILRNNTLLMDVLRAMNLNMGQVQILSPRQIKMLPKDIFYNKWYLGTQIPSESTGIIITSSILEKLANDREEKKELWKQIYLSNLDIVHNIQ
ncbi:DNA polymerase III subunit psi [Candidatus Erwinia haradaeae]|uniref:DNA polymerase III subunit psi n=1 Tax=Candidatus Erwinia haradaeae TaxID=1922217 RepID=A0A451D7Y9_9GAMM|nr:DNA polymerase III subunit psi [Candidatus Erwinia haradaeae]VFP81961.1 DNA polymerase III subunit psi [Candidatus Erwinia haradaeae]